MTKILKVRKVGTSLIMTIPKDIAMLFKIKVCTEIEMDPISSETLMLRIKK